MPELQTFSPRIVVYEHVPDGLPYSMELARDHVRAVVEAAIQGAGYGVQVGDLSEVSEDQGSTSVWLAAASVRKPAVDPEDIGSIRAAVRKGIVSIFRGGWIEVDPETHPLFHTVSAGSEPLPPPCLAVPDALLVPGAPADR